MAAGVLVACRACRPRHGLSRQGFKFIVPNVPGGSTDIIGRLVAQKLSERWKQLVVVDKRGAVSGIVGAEAGQKAPSDGGTFGNSGTHIMSHGQTAPPDATRRTPMS